MIGAPFLPDSNAKFPNLPSLGSTCLKKAPAIAFCPLPRTDSENLPESLIRGCRLESPLTPITNSARFLAFSSISDSSIATLHCLENLTCLSQCPQSRAVDQDGAGVLSAT